MLLRCEIFVSFPWEKTLSGADDIEGMDRIVPLHGGRLSQPTKKLQIQSGHGLRTTALAQSRAHCVTSCKSLGCAGTTIQYQSSLRVAPYRSRRD